MTALGGRIAGLVAAAGPIGIADYMALCLFDPQHGYYTTREPFGAAGDFTTAPEVSQMFGELIAVWLHDAWTAAGRPQAAVVAEIGPGRGTLMRDMARTFHRLDPGFVRLARFELIETSPRLREVQRATLADSLPDFAWHESLATLPEGPLLIVGNELFDAVPIRQFVRTQAGWRERVVALDARGGLGLVAGATGIDPSLLPPGCESAPVGAVAEIAPAREALMEAIAERIARGGGAGLFIDYGHARPGIGDTLQAVRRHAFDDVLAHPGEADLTAHVDFEALARAARRHALRTGLLTQGEFLLEMGLLERAGSLGAGKPQAVQERIRSEVERLAGPQAMGDLFKVLAVLPPGLDAPPFPQG